MKLNLKLLNFTPIMANSSITKERKFHDAWAFYLFIVFSLVMNTFFIVNTTGFFDQMLKLSSSYHFIECFFLNLAFTIFFLLISLLGCYFAPKVIIIASVIVVPLGSLIAYFGMGLSSGSSSSAIGICLLIINIFFILMAVFMVLSNLDYIALALKASSKIFGENFAGIFGLQVLFFFIFNVASVPSFLVNSDNGVVKVLKYSVILLMSWMGGISIYFMEVFISSVVFFHIKKDEESVFNNSLNNSCYALGSISYGALLVAIITVLKSMIADARSEQRGQKKNIFTEILMAIASGILNMVGDIVEFANNIAFPYLSINGTDYKESVTQSFQTIATSGYAKIASYYGLDYVISMLSIFFCFLVYLFNKNLLFSYIGVSTDTVIYALIISVVFAGLFIFTLSLLRSAVMALIFATVTCRDELNNYDPKFLEALEGEKKKVEMKSAPPQSQAAQ